MTAAANARGYVAGRSKPGSGNAGHRRAGHIAKATVRGETMVM